MEIRIGSPSAVRVSWPQEHEAWRVVIGSLRSTAAAALLVPAPPIVFASQIFFVALFFGCPSADR